MDSDVTVMTPIGIQVQVWDYLSPHTGQLLHGLAPINDVQATYHAPVRDVIARKSTYSVHHAVLSWVQEHTHRTQQFYRNRWRSNQ